MAIGESFFVTGALGCIGAWTVRNLVQAGTPVTVFDLGRDRRRLELILTPEELAQIRFLQGDITDLDALQRALLESGATHVIHLAALQVPFCRADPSLGARVNVVGTVNVFEAARRAGIGRVVYASSVAVFGASDEYPEQLLAEDAPLAPNNLYGVYKQANEGTARIYWQDNGVSSIGLRPHTLYGPGRDQGMTSGPTKAMLAAAAGQPYHIPYGGRLDMQYADDIARIFIGCARVPFHRRRGFQRARQRGGDDRSRRGDRSRSAVGARRHHLRSQAAAAAGRAGRQPPAHAPRQPARYIVDRRREGDHRDLSGGPWPTAGSRSRSRRKPRQASTTESHELHELDELHELLFSRHACGTDNNENS